MYAATETGITVIPANILIQKFNIPIELTAVRINNKDTILIGHYELEPHQNSIDLEFSGIELSGHFKNAQISKDQGILWTDINSNNLSLQFESGEHYVWLRAVDVNGNIANKILKLQFNIAKRFYEEWWFVLSLSLLILIGSISIYNMIARRKHKQQIDLFLNQQALDELEIQALKAQINPHFVFNCLNSIKGFIYDEDFEQADLYLDKFSSLLRNTLDYSSMQSISLKYEADISINEIAIPAMILQPYVENAIKHGVCNLDDNTGKIIIKVYLVQNCLHVKIDDNGIGREQANNLKHQRKIIHESKGTLLTQRRIELYQIELEIIDKLDQHDKSLGTTIHLKLPLRYL
jgi:hypothetical protein